MAQPPPRPHITRGMDGGHALIQAVLSMSVFE